MSVKQPHVYYSIGKHGGIHILKKCDNEGCAFYLERDIFFFRRGRWGRWGSRVSKKGYCCQACHWKALSKLLGNNTFNWKGGQYKSRGRIWVMTRNHPRANIYGYVLRSHLIMENLIGNYIPKGYVVHHGDDKSLNDNINNLELWTDSKHRSYHSKLHRGTDGRFKHKYVREGQ